MDSGIFRESFEIGIFSGKWKARVFSFGVKESGKRVITDQMRRKLWAWLVLGLHWAGSFSGLTVDFFIWIVIVDFSEPSCFGGLCVE